MGTTRIAALIAIATLGVTALTGCSATGSVDGATPTTAGALRTASASPTTTAPTAPATSTTPRPTSTIPNVPGVDYDGGSIPDSCEGLLTPGKWQFADDPLNDPDVVGANPTMPTTAFTPVLQADGKRLYCVWRDPRVDVTNVTITVVVVDSARAYDALRGLHGYDCAHDSEGYRCQKVSQNPQYPVTDGDTYFTRGDVGIRITQSNVPTSGLLDDVMAHTF